MSDVNDDQSIRSNVTNATLSSTLTREGALQKISVAAERAASKSKIKSMKTHFKVFSEKFWRVDNTQGAALVRKVDGSVYSCDDLEHHMINSHLVQTFATYLASFARNLNKKNSPALLKLSGAAQYFSTFRTELLKKFADDPPLSCLDAEHQSMCNRNILKLKTDISRKNGIPLVDTTQPVRVEELQAFSTAIYWDGNEEFAEFLHLYTSMVMNCGRGSEV